VRKGRARALTDRLVRGLKVVEDALESKRYGIGSVVLGGDLIDGLHEDKGSD
jgi:hypothetical protein